MDHEILVRVVDRGADGPEQREPLVERRPALVPESIERHALDVVHDEVRQPLVGRAPIEDPGDVRVIEVGERPALVMEPPDDLVGV
jgi:hypothetical protein